jgi:hypothetical protein
VPGGRASRPHIIAARSCTRSAGPGGARWWPQDASLAWRAGTPPRASRRRQRGWPRSSQAADAGTPAGGVGGVPAGVNPLAHAAAAAAAVQVAVPVWCFQRFSSISSAPASTMFTGRVAISARGPQASERRAHARSGATFAESPSAERLLARSMMASRPSHLWSQTAPGSAPRAASPGSPGSPGRWPRFAVAPRRTARPRRDYGCCYRDCEGPEGRWWRCWPSSRC